MMQVDQLLASKSKERVNSRNFFDQPIKDEIKISENIRKLDTGQGEDYKTGCLLDYRYSKENYKITAIDLSKHQASDVDPRGIQQVIFTANLDQAGEIFTFLIYELVKKTIMDFTRIYESIVQ